MDVKSCATEILEIETRNRNKKYHTFTLEPDADGFLLIEYHGEGYNLCVIEQSDNHIRVGLREDDFGEVYGNTQYDDMENDDEDN